MRNFRFRCLFVSDVEAVTVFSAHCISDRMLKEGDYMVQLNSKIWNFTKGTQKHDIKCTY